jgi:hypothetical protein
VYTLLVSGWKVVVTSEGEEAFQVGNNETILTSHTPPSSLYCSSIKVFFHHSFVFCFFSFYDFDNEKLKGFLFILFYFFFLSFTTKNDLKREKEKKKKKKHKLINRLNPGLFPPSSWVTKTDES